MLLLNDFLAFCQRFDILPETITREQVGLSVHDLAQHPNPKGAKLLSIENGLGLSNSTMQQRITVLRLFCDSLVERQLRQDNPVGRGHYVPGKAFGGARARGLLPRHQKLPWLPSDQEWQNLLHGLGTEILRNQVMLLLAYDGALRREELVRLEMSDFNFAYRQIRGQAEHAKNGRERIVSYEKTTSRLLEAYLRQRRTLSTQRGQLFLSESHRNASSPLALVTWSKVVQKLAGRAELSRFTTHTPRHLRLTHMARAHMELHQIATYAGHKSLATTMLSIHLSGVELTDFTYELAAEFVSMVMNMTVGEWADASSQAHMHEKLGQPFRPSAKERFLGAVRTFFRDCQEWHWIPIRLNPHRAFQTPRSLHNLIGPNPRVVQRDLWSKMLWAAMNLEQEDLPVNATRCPIYPLELVRAIAAVWCFAALRSNEIFRLRVGCIRWQ